MNKTLIILERKNGWYGGYQKDNDNNYTQVFDITADLLFFCMKKYVDKGFSIQMLDKSQETKFLKNKITVRFNTE